THRKTLLIRVRYQELLELSALNRRI
ncbi:unnamed protein product, partial [Allacma fusca]